MIREVTMAMAMAAQATTASAADYHVGRRSEWVRRVPPGQSALYLEKAPGAAYPAWRAPLGQGGCWRSVLDQWIWVC